MIIEIPGYRTLEINNLVLDYNGTIARDGQLLPEAAQRITALAEQVPVYILTADTYGNVAAQCRPLNVCIKTFPQAGAAVCKARIVSDLGLGVCAVGNGFNDIPMFEISDECYAVENAVEELKSTLVGLLNYGAATQEKFTYGPENLVNKDLTDAERALATVSQEGQSNLVTGNGYKDNTLAFESKIQLNFKFDSKVVTKDMYAIITYIDLDGIEQEIRIEGEKFTGKSTLAVSPGIPLACGRKMITCTIYNQAGEEVTQTVDSIEGYLTRKIAAGGGEFYEAIWKLVLSAEAYFVR